MSGAFPQLAPPGRPALACSTLPATVPAAIEPRRWAYGDFLLFGAAAVLGAVDGGGKGSIAVGMLLAVITGRPLLGEPIWRSGPVAIVSYEDDETEWQRRIAAACLHYEIDPAAVFPHIRFIHRPGARVSFAALGDGGVLFPDGDDIARILTKTGAVMLLVDAFNHAHDLGDGNSNVLIAAVAGEMSRIARESGAAVLVLHHLRKGSSGNPDDLMGATSLRATFRSCRILQRMTPEEATKMNLKDAWRYIRIAGSKENSAPPPENAPWCKLESVPLGNGTVEYPDGDNMGVATRWTPRPLFEGMDPEALAAVFAALRAAEYSPSRQARRRPWAGKPLIEIGGRSEQESAGIVRAWLANRVLLKSQIYDAETRNKVEIVTVDATKADDILGRKTHGAALPEAAFGDAE